MISLGSTTVLPSGWATLSNAAAISNIDAAIDKIVSEGLPSKPKQPNGKLIDYAISMPTASSSGRETEKRLQ